METKQEMFWKGKFGDEYLSRKGAKDFDELYPILYGTTRTELNKEFFSKLNKDISILEVGCNRAEQLHLLKDIGFTNLWGIDINHRSIQIAKIEKSFNIIESSGFDIPFKDNYFDLVMTNVMLIHVDPQDLSRLMAEIYRVSKKYIYGYEFYSKDCEMIPYRGNVNRMWKNDFKTLFLNQFKDLKIVKEKELKYLKDDNKDNMYLLEK